MFGLPLLLDKSVLEMISHQEHRFLCTDACDYVLTDALLLEVFGVLAKKETGGRPASIKAISDRLISGSHLSCEPFKKLVLAELHGIRFPLDGRVPIMNENISGKEDVILYEESPFERLVRHWSTEVIEEKEEELSAEYRETKKRWTLDLLLMPLERNRIILVRVRNYKEAVLEAERLLAFKSLQLPLINAFLELITFREVNELTSSASKRCYDTPGFWIKNHAPYTYHCIRAYLALMLAWKYKVAPQDTNNAMDLQYFYYLPFCVLFSSEDRLHRNLAPHLMHSRQKFYSGTELRETIREMRGLLPDAPVLEMAHVTSKSPVSQVELVRHLRMCALSR